MAQTTQGGGLPVIRQAEEADLDAIAAFEVTIAEVSFGADAVTDPAVHRKKLANALNRDAESMLVAVRPSGEVVGWLWLAVNTNFLTGAKYANFRSLAVAEVEDRDPIAESLLARALDYARRRELTEITGKVHVSNTGMRVLYRRFGFEPVTLTMKRRLDD